MKNFHESTLRILARKCGGFRSTTVVHRDEERGIRRMSIVVTHGSTGPGLGGTRKGEWESDSAMLGENYRLALGMETKSLFHELPFTGGKVCVETVPGASDEAVYRCVAERVRELHGLIVTTEDMNTSPAQMSIMHAVAPGLILGRPEQEGGSGDPSPYTATGVFEAIRATARHALGRDIEGLHVHVKGLGHVGGIVARRLLDAGARLTVVEVNKMRLAGFTDLPGVTVAHPDAPVEADVFCPCAGGGDVGPDFAGQVLAIVGAANNQLTSDEDVAAILHRKGIWYVPDWAANGGGLISVGAEYLGHDRTWARAHAHDIGDRIADLLKRSQYANTVPLIEALAVCDARRLKRATEAAEVA